MVLTRSSTGEYIQNPYFDMDGTRLTALIQDCLTISWCSDIWVNAKGRAAEICVVFEEGCFEARLSIAGTDICCADLSRIWIMH